MASMVMPATCDRPLPSRSRPITRAREPAGARVGAARRSSRPWVRRPRTPSLCRTPSPARAAPARPASCSAAPPAALGTILSIWAHPDDETYLAGGVMAAADRGQRVVCVSATAGEHGTDDPDDLATGTGWASAPLGGGRPPWRCSAWPSTGCSAARRRPRRPDERGPRLGRRLLDDDRARHDPHVRPRRHDLPPRPHRRPPLGHRGLAARGRRAAAAVRHADRRAPRPVRRDLYEEWNMYMSDERPTGVPAAELARPPRAERSTSSTASSPRCGPWPPRPATSIRPGRPRDLRHPGGRRRLHRRGRRSSRRVIDATSSVLRAAGGVTPRPWQS